jgi:hypothetical protein
MASELWRIESQCGRETGYFGEFEQACKYAIEWIRAGKYEDGEIRLNLSADGASKFFSFVVPIKANAEKDWEIHKKIKNGCKEIKEWNEMRQLV